MRKIAIFVFTVLTVFLFTACPDLWMEPEPSNDAGLFSLVLSHGTIQPGFNANTSAYTATVDNAIETITVTPTSSDSNASIRVEGTTVASGTASGYITLSSGVPREISISVTAEDGETTMAYTVTVTRSEATDTDTMAPVITLNGDNPIYITLDSTFTDPGAVVTDNVDDNRTITGTGTVDTATVGTYTLTYNAVDAAGNVAAEVIRTVIVWDSAAGDTVPPTITLNGDNPIYITLDGTFTDPGAVVTDNVDEERTITGTGTVDTTTAGSYTISYNAVDAAGNAAVEVTRTVNVNLPVETIEWEDDGEGWIQYYTNDDQYLDTDPYKYDLGTHDMVLQPILEFEHKRVSGVNSKFGVIFCTDFSIGNAYTLQINPNNSDYLIIEYTAGGEYFPEGHTHTYNEAINNEYGQINKVRIERTGAGIFTIIINDDTDNIINYTDDHGGAYSSGDYGLGTKVDSNEDFPNNPVDVRFRVLESTPNYLTETDVPDPNLRQAFEDKTGKTFGEITDHDLLLLTELVIPDYGITDLTGIEYCDNVGFLLLNGNSLLSLNPITGMENVSAIDLWGCGIDDISILANLSELTHIKVVGNDLDIVDYSIFTHENFPHLIRLALYGYDDATGQAFTDKMDILDFLSGHSGLEELTLFSFSLSHSEFTDLYNQVLVPNNSSLDGLFLDDNNLTNESLTLISNLSNLTRLCLANYSNDSDITVITALGNMSNLNYLDLYGTGITDITPLEDLYNNGGFSVRSNSDIDICLTNCNLELWPVSPNRVVVDYLVGEGVRIDYENGNQLVSSDLVTWSLATDNTPYLDRFAHTHISFNNKMWIIAGICDVEDQKKNDIWSSVNGINWVEETSNAGFPARFDHTSVVFDNKMWVIGGISSDGIYLNDVWYSEDGVDWFEATGNAEFTPRLGHTSVTFGGKIWVIAGSGDFGSRVNDIWSSSDGITWVEETGNAGFSSRLYHTSVVFDNKIWIIAGSDSDGDKNDVWCSEDGIAWTEVTGGNSIPNRSYHASVVFDNKMWVIGGAWAQTALYADAWYSEDGQTWVQATETVGNYFRYEHDATVFQDRIWISGGYSMDVEEYLASGTFVYIHFTDIWFSND